MFGIRPEKGPKTKICRAIHAKLVIQFWYGLDQRSRFCVVEPYCYGLLPDNEETLLCYQVEGHGGLDVPSGWKLYRPFLMSGLTLTHEDFTGRRTGPGYDSRRRAFTTVYCQVVTDRGDIAVESTGVRPAEEPAGTAKPARGHNELMKRFRLGHWFFPAKNKP